jgi:hypothetical protein
MKEIENLIKRLNNGINETPTGELRNLLSDVNIVLTKLYFSETVVQKNLDIVEELLDEKVQIDNKINKLKIFISGDLFNKAISPKSLLLQLSIMQSYSQILGQRIDDINKFHKEKI